MKSHWRDAVQENTISAYEEFMRQHPKSEYANEASVRLEELYIKKIWREVSSKNTIQAYQSFLNKYPQSDFTNKANSKIEGLEWKKTIEMNNIEAYQSFLKKYPQSAFTDKAYSKIEGLEWKKAIEMDNIEAYRKFIELYPNSNFIDEEIERAFSEAQEINQVEAYQNFFATYPTNKYSETVKEYIRELTSFYKTATKSDIELFEERNKSDSKSFKGIMTVTETLFTPEGTISGILSFYVSVKKEFLRATPSQYTFKTKDDQIARFYLPRGIKKDGLESMSVFSLSPFSGWVQNSEAKEFLVDVFSKVPEDEIFKLK